MEIPSRPAAPIRVGIDARLRHGESGGVESVTVGLAEGLSGLDGDDEYLFLTLRGEDDWIRPHLRGNARAVSVPKAGGGRIKRIRDGVRRIPGATDAYRTIRRSTGRFPGRPPVSDGTLERAQVDVVHFVNQAGFRTEIPSIYHPHDLQHRHLPELFSKDQHAYREAWYGELSEQAAMIAVASSWTKADVEQELSIAPEKVHVVPWAAPLGIFDLPSGDAGDSFAATLPPEFVLYPAQTWAHKNHVGLVRAIGILRRSVSLDVPVVFTGLRNEHASVIDREVSAAGVEDLVTWTGFVEPPILTSIFRRARAVVIPTKFEAASGPLWEAFAAGIPAACSAVTSLPEQAGDAALLFDPENPGEIADAVRRLWNETDLRLTLASRGTVRVSRFTWRKTAERFRAHYRRLAGRTLSADDSDLLTAPPAL